LNIGPDPTGAVVPFERDVLLKMGAWLERNGYAVYAADPSPFAAEFEWGDVTVKGREMYLLLTGKYPQDGKVILPLSVGERVVEVTPQMYADPADVHVIRVELEEREERKVATIEDKAMLSWENATPDYSYSCFDYYSNYRSVVAYNWLVKNKKAIKGVRLGYAPSDVGKRVSLTVGDTSFEVSLDQGEIQELDAMVSVLSRSVGRMRGGIFDRPVSLGGVEWTEVDSAYVRCADRPFANHLMKVVLNARKSCSVNLKVLAGNGVELLVYDRVTGDYVSMMKHLNPYRTTERTEKVVLDLQEGRHEVLLRSYNRFEDSSVAGFALSDDQKVYRMTLIMPHVLGRGSVHIGVSPLDRLSPHTDCGLHNLRVRLVK
jgi:alpha-L-fucosidase